MTIDGDETVELDFSAMMPTIAYAYGGLDSVELDAWEYEGDPYELGGIDRDIVKKVFVICLNAEDRKQAVKAVRSLGLFGDVECYEGAGHADYANTIISALLEKHSHISRFFFSGAWKELGFQESQIMFSILEHCKNFNRPVLAIHDGLVCRAGDAVMMVNFMRDAFTTRLAVRPKIVIKDSLGKVRVA